MAFGIKEVAEASILDPELNLAFDPENKFYDHWGEGLLIYCIRRILPSDSISFENIPLSRSPFILRRSVLNSMRKVRILRSISNAKPREGESALQQAAAQGETAAAKALYLGH